ncbi:MAG: hypothetical protein RSC08_07240 [Oscillospiraceae bacterium]
MKRILPLFLALTLLLAGCGGVPLEEQSIQFPAVSRGDSAAPTAYQLGDSPAAGSDDEGYLENAVCYGVPGLAAYDWVDDRLFSFTFVTAPGGEAGQSDLDALLAGLTSDYGKPAASDEENGVYQWLAANSGVTVTLTGHLAETPAYVSFTVAGNWEMLCHLGVVTAAETGGFDLLTKLDGEFLPLSVDHVTSVWGDPAKDEDSGNGSRTLTYEGAATDASLNGAVGDVYFSFYNGKLYSAGVSFPGDASPQNDNALFWQLYSNFTALHGTRQSEYSLGYALLKDGGYLPAQTQYTVWQPSKTPYALELVRTGSREEQSVQLSMTASWVLRDKEALAALAKD